MGSFRQRMNQDESDKRERNNAKRWGLATSARLRGTVMAAA